MPNGRPGAGQGSRERREVRCAIYTRKSTEEGLEQEFNSLDAQREAAEAYIASQPSERWLRMKASAASRWASRELNSCSRPSSVDFRV